VQYVENNKAEDNNWFHLESDENGIKWSGRCWGVHEMQTYEFDLEFEVRTCGRIRCYQVGKLRTTCIPLSQIPVTYPATAPEIAIPALDGKTSKMYRCVQERKGKAAPNTY
jgi:ufm1-conjugating enzyme 1